MREAYYESGWIIDPEDGVTVVGVNLGFDDDAQRGVHAPVEVMGVPFCGVLMGLDTRRPCRHPDFIHFETYSQQCGGLDDKAYQVGLLLAGRRPADVPQYLSSLRKLTSVVDADPLLDDGGRAPLTWMMTAWGDDGFALQVRGDINIYRLRELHERVLEMDVMVAPKSMSAFVCDGLNLVIISKMQNAWINEIMAADMAANPFSAMSLD